MSFPKELFQSDVLINPLESTKNISALKLFLQLIKSSCGPYGKLKQIQNVSGGHVTITSISSRLFPILSVRNLFVKLVIASVKSHISIFGNDGLYCTLLLVTLLTNSINLPYSPSLVSNLYCHFGTLFINILKSVDNPCAHDITFTNLRHLKSFVHSVISSKPGCLLTDENKTDLTFLTLKAFLNTLPNSNAESRFFGNVHICVAEGSSVSDSKLFCGILIRCPEIIKQQLISSITEKTNLKVALFKVSLAGDAKIHVTNLYTKDEASYYDEILSHLKTIARKLISDEVDLVLCQKVIHPSVKKLLEDHSILVIDRMGFDITQHVERVLGTCGIASLIIDSSSAYGTLNSLSTLDIGTKRYFLIQNEKNQYWTLVLCNFNEEAVNETKVVCQQAIDALYRFIRNPAVCCGAGCTEVYTASILKTMVSRDCSKLAVDFDCSIGTVTEVLENFISSNFDAAISIHQGTKLTFLTEHKYNHLWKLKDEKFPDGNERCQCGQYSAVSIQPSQWQFLQKMNLNSLVFNNAAPEDDSNLSFQPHIIDELQSKVNAAHVAFETSSNLLNVGLCVMKK